MPVIDLKLDGDNAFPELRDDPNVVVVDNQTPWTVARLTAGMTSGAPSLVLKLELPDGRTLLAETSQAMWVAAARAFEARTEFEQSQN